MDERDKEKKEVINKFKAGKDVLTPAMILYFKKYCVTKGFIADVVSKPVSSPYDELIDPLC